MTQKPHLVRPIRSLLDISHLAPTKCLILAKDATQNGLSELQYALRDGGPNRAEIGRLSPVIVGSVLGSLEFPTSLEFFQRMAH
jgi:hypothetical protein